MCSIAAAYFPPLSSIQIQAKVYSSSTEIEAKVYSSSTEIEAKVYSSSTEIEAKVLGCSTVKTKCLRKGNISHMAPATVSAEGSHCVCRGFPL